MPNERLPWLREQVRKLPCEPGVYIMRDSSEKIIYIGKAKELRHRVSSYFRKLDPMQTKTQKLVEHIHRFDYIVTASEFEALVLEASMIKQHKPKYNILLKDDKGYCYIRISPGAYPRITSEMQRAEDGARYLGPYVSSFVTKQTVEEVNTAFLLPTCKRKFPKEIGRGRPCLNLHIKRCMGVCAGKISEADYTDSIAQAIEFIADGSQQSIDRLTTRMNTAAEALDFERAAMLRDKIKAIHRISERQNVVFTRAVNQDVFAFVQGVTACCVSLLKFREQRLVDKQDYLIGEVESLPAARREFLISYYSAMQEIPRHVSVDGECDDSELIERFLTEKSGRNTELRIPERGERMQLIEMARRNAAQTLSHRAERVSGREVAALDELARLLNLAAPPEYIELYDISNMGSETVVAGMVVFENGRPLKAAYKKFNIKTVIVTDDYASMREVVRRRLSHYAEEKERGKGFGRLPDLILLDGGKGHVAAVAPILEELGFEIPLYGLVKNQRHRTRAIATNGGEISITSTRSAFTLLSKMQDEVHRFSITFMQQKRTKNMFASALTQVEGIGDTRVKALLKHFRTQTALKAASVEQLLEVKGMNRPSAERLHLFLHDGE